MAKPSMARVGMMVVAAALFGGLTACAVPGTTAPSARIPMRGQQAVVEIEGQGTVKGPGDLECRANDASNASCRGTWADLGTASLVAHPAPGWKFERWEWQAVDAAIAPSFSGGETHRYTAVFAPAQPQVSRR